MTESTMKPTFNLEKFRKVVNEAADSDEIVMSKEEALLLIAVLDTAKQLAGEALHGDVVAAMPAPTACGCSLDCFPHASFASWPEQHAAMGIVIEREG